ncbi:tripartite tricarboxylate transporter substrate binding protein [Ideonella azotifigens]|uniref:Tripartite tricarboxylate transporter substrate binding protein n=1 Tax=Ideonella azotifigens TaxID=513160 RepID=A0ABP3VRH8_9BURK|nr:tripartite tricarboxylate transporter substrate-binding protein [Ideonella azotifigens]MCD2340439.1 tripartite tricarboxylate transporter substrate binding protein [Ideonella azotifigens]
MRNALLNWTTWLLLLAAQGAALAQGTWPGRAVHLVVPFAAGTAPDMVGRLLAEGLAESLAVPVLVENLPGAGGTLGVDKVARAAGDGHTLVLSGDAALVVGAAYGVKPPYQVASDLVPISQLVLTPNVLVVPPELPVSTLAEFVALARSQPGRFSYASAGNGTSSHRAGELLNAMAGLDMVHVPSSGSPLPDVMAGRVQLFFANAASLPLVREGKLRALAVSSLQRLPALPELATVAESGYPGFEAVAWFGLLAPKGTSSEIVERLQAEAAKALARPAMRDRLQAMGAVPVGGSSAAFAALIAAETTKWAAAPMSVRR